MVARGGRATAAASATGSPADHQHRFLLSSKRVGSAVFYLQTRLRARRNNNNNNTHDPLRCVREVGLMGGEVGGGDAAAERVVLLLRRNSITRTTYTI